MVLSKQGEFTDEINQKFPQSKSDLVLDQIGYYREGYIQMQISEKKKKKKTCLLLCIQNENASLTSIGM
jgi:hypothetical protein